MTAPEVVSNVTGAPVHHYFKVYDTANRHVASCQEALGAVVVVAIYGDGASIKYRHGLKLWHEGREGVSAGLEPSIAAKIVSARLAELSRRRFA